MKTRKEEKGKGKVREERSIRVSVLTMHDHACTLVHAGDVRYYRPGNRVAFCCVGSVAIGRPSSPSAIVSRMRADSRTVIANRRVALMRHNRVTYPAALGYAIKARSSSRGNTCPR